MRHSILLSLGIGLILVAIGAFVVVPRVVNRSISENLLREFDDGLLAMARGLGPLVEYEDGRYEFDFAANGIPGLDHAFEVRAGDGSLLAVAEPLIRVPAGRGGSAPFFFDAPSPEGQLRCVLLRVPAVVEDDDEEDDEDPRTSGRLIAARNAGIEPYADIVVGVVRAEIDARIAAVSREVDESLLLLGFLVLMFVGSSIFYTWRALRGVTQNLATAPATGLGPIEWKPRPPRELAPLTQALDGALEKAGAAVERERDVIAGMAHELRTPVAEMLATTEIALDRADADDALRPALADVRAVALQMKATVETMLTVARGKAPDDARRIEDVDVGTLWDEIAAAAAAKAADRGVTFQRAGTGSVHVRCDPAALRIVLTTLAENAALHAPAGSRVDVDVRDDRVEVSNPAPHLDLDDLPRLTEPLWHKAGAGVAHRGLGLGLYLASEVAGHAGFDLALALHDERLLVTVGFPRST